MGVTWRDQTVEAPFVGAHAVRHLAVVDPTDILPRSPFKRHPRHRCAMGRDEPQVPAETIRDAEGERVQVIADPMEAAHGPPPR